MDKRIIYCWFGGSPFPSVVQKCLNSWKAVMPDYEIIKVDESVFNLDEFPNAKRLYERNEYAYISDIARVWALANYGGIYFDTDIYALKRMDDFLELPNFCGVLPNGLPNVGVLGGKEFWQEILDEYRIMGEKFIPIGLLVKKKLEEEKRIRVSDEFANNSVALIPDNFFYTRKNSGYKAPSSAYNVHLYSGFSLKKTNEVVAENFINQKILNNWN